jgi:tetratricopeptide (TPR) repeat protein
MTKTNKALSKKHTLRAAKLLQEAMTFHQAGYRQKAEELYRSILEKYPNYPEAIYFLGVIAHQENKNDLAITQYEQAIILKPDYAEAHYSLGHALQVLSRMEEAIDQYKQAIAIKPDYAEAHYNLGHALQDLGRGEEATAQYEQAIALKPDLAEPHINLGNTLQSLGRMEEAILHFEQAIALKPDYAGAHNNLGNALQDLGREEEAIASFEQAIALKPDLAEAHLNLGNTLQSLGRGEEAIASIEQAIALTPDLAEPHFNLGHALQSLGRGEEAIASFEQAIDLKPDYAEAHLGLGNALKDLDRMEEAAACFEQAIALRSDDYAGAHINLGNALKSLGRMEEAVGRYEQAIALKPDYSEAHLSLGLALQELGRMEEAIASIEQAISLKPDYAEAHRNLSVIKPNNANISVIEKFLTDSEIPEKNLIHYHFALGNILNDLNSFDEAFGHYHKANTLKRKTVEYDSQKHSDHVNRLISVYSKQYFESGITTGSDSKLPVFIVGMPRSGTSLVEQIVSSHPQVYGAGELSFFTSVAHNITNFIKEPDTYPECMLECDDSVVVKFSSEYLEKLGNHSQGTIRITDKMPDNFLRIGLIKTLFPKARIIHCQRNALDTCTSIFLLYFVLSNEYTFDLKELGQYYLDYERLMAHWHNLFSSDIYDVQYEELSNNQEIVSRQLIKYLGLEWDSKCLDFHKNKRAVKTASNLQVRQPIYKTSINRWKKYEKHLGPLTEILKHHT